MEQNNQSFVIIKENGGSYCEIWTICEIGHIMCFLFCRLRSSEPLILLILTDFTQIFDGDNLSKPSKLTETQ